MSADEILKWWQSNDNRPIYGYMYGYPYVYSVEKDGSYWRKDRVIQIEKKKIELGRNKDCFIFVWGGPGPDFNIYRFPDYGITWAFSEDEISNDYVMKKFENGWKLVKSEVKHGLV